MMSTFKKILVGGTLAIAASLTMAATAGAQASMRTFTVFNNSHYRIDKVFVSQTNRTSWGIDRLGAQVLRPTYRFDLSVVPDWYDVKLVDEDGDTCVVNNLDFRNGDTWTITDRLLLACEFATR